MDTGYRIRFKDGKRIYRWMLNHHTGEWAWWMTGILMNNGEKFRRAKPQYNIGPLK